ncbi:hypothetical protein DENIS_0961 [Desulfonema ishimotonii]|uniref:Uncharacterized protein n=1 Tax=Desulfonema ishimotonii TaxID=45657 RepID=A0A401FSS6_9BACT|nr:DUF99 family protein [Desulfonema ishimotonii]GBC60019.1 hypothetical protein DENIS_0961 [Desulfonema ishimotonii]
MARGRLSNVIAFDDAPFPRHHRGPVRIVGTVFADLRFDGVLMGEVEKDGADAAESLTRLVASSKFAGHARLIMLQGVALGGFNVVDVFHIHRALKMPVLVVARRQPDMAATERALRHHVPGGAEKWAIIERIGPMEPAGNVWVQRVGLTPEQADSVVRRFSVHSNIPEPIRVAHLIAGALSDGQSRGAP